MLSYHNNPKIKETILTQLQAHYDADEIVKGKYWEGGKGCAVGCTIHSSDHSEYETRFGIPEFLAYLEDGIFENLPNHIAKAWPLRFMNSIPIGKDLSTVKHQFLHWLLIDPNDGVIRFVQKDSEQERAIVTVANLHRMRIQGKIVSEEAWAAARDAARVAAWAAARDAAWAAWAAGVAAWAAADAARAAADAAGAAADAARAAADAAGAAGVAARVAARAAARAAARVAHFEKMADKLISLLENV